MKKINLLPIACFIFLLLGCEKPLQYKYQDKPQLVTCPGADKALMHEALYSFQEDIGAYYNKFTDYKKGSTTYYIEAYKQFVYVGFIGEANYKEIVTPHTLQVLKKLKENKTLWTLEKNKSKLNYSHEYVSCLFENISDEDMRTRLKSLLEVNYLSPEIVAEPMRVEVLKIVGDEHLAMYMMLDAYYQYLMDIDFSNTVK
ncbi:MAG: hypothetical protein R2781_05050 [Flavobacteriaceae bacterium]